MKSTKQILERKKKSTKLQGSHLTSAEEVNKATSTALRSLFFHCMKCFEKDGDYVDVNKVFTRLNAYDVSWVKELWGCIYITLGSSLLGIFIHVTHME